MSQGKSDARYCFTVKWYDPAASLERQYQLIYYTADGTVEMVSTARAPPTLAAASDDDASSSSSSSTAAAPAANWSSLHAVSSLAFCPLPQYDLKNRRTFLKRCDYPAVSAKDLYKGGIITIYSRQLTIVEYGDAFTAKVFESSASAIVVQVAPAALPSMGRIIDAICSSELTICELRLLPDGLALKLTGSHTVEVWEALLPQINASLGANSVTTIGDCFSMALPKPVVGDSSTSSLLLVRAHAVKAGALGRIVDQVLGSGFEVVNAHMTQLTRPNAGEFLEVYKGVVPECVDWIEELISGKVVALQLRFSEKPDATVLALRELCGAHDPEIASHLHPQSLRALYGQSKVKNAVHCTDLPEDGPLEVDYFFSVLA